MVCHAHIYAGLCHNYQEHQAQSFSKRFLPAAGEVDADVVNITQDNTSTENLQQGELVTVILPPSLFLQITQEENDTISNTTEATGVIFTFYESSVLFSLANEANRNNDDSIFMMVGSPVIGAAIAGLEVAELAEPFTFLLRLNNEVT